MSRILNQKLPTENQAWYTLGHGDLILVSPTI